MGKLDHLKIKKAPACFESWARNFNQQVDLLSSIEGGPGIDIQVAHSPRKAVALTKGQHRPKEQPRGKILLTLRPSAVNGLGVGGNGATPNSTLAIGASGQLVGVVPATNAGAGNYPQALIAFTPGGGTVQAALGSVSVSNASKTAVMSSTQDEGIYMTDGTKEFFVNYSLLTQNMGIREFTGCNSGNAANYLVLASAFY